jgi:hypothetical protein
VLIGQSLPPVTTSIYKIRKMILPNLLPLK